MIGREDRPTVFGKSPPRVLVVEDDEQLRRLLVRLVEHLGCVVMGSRTGAEAREHAGSGVWDVVMLDLGLPDIDGLDLLPQLAALQCERPPAFIVLSGREVATREVPEGVGVLMKPVSIIALMAATKAAVRAARGWGPVDGTSRAR